MIGCINNGGGGGRLPTEPTKWLFSRPELSWPELPGVAHSLVKDEAGLVSLGTVIRLLLDEGDFVSLFMVLGDLMLLLLLLLLFAAVVSFDCACCCRHLALLFLNQTCK